MGLFDIIFVKCPSCEEILEFQSKGGECVLEKYTKKMSLGKSYYLLLEILLNALNVQKR